MEPNKTPSTPTQTNTPQVPLKQESKQPEKSLLADLTIGLPGPLRLLSESLQLLQKKFLLLTSAIFIPLFIAFLLSKIPFLIKTPSQIILILLTSIIFFVDFIIISYGYIALLFAIKDNEENISLGAAYKRADKRFQDIWQVALLIALIVTIGFISFIIPGIILLAWFCVAIFVTIVEDLNSIDALLQSKAYVQNYLGTVLARFLFLGLFITVIYLPFIVFFPLHNALLYQILFIILTALALPIASTYGFLIYGNLRLVKTNSADYAETLKSVKVWKPKLKLLKPAFVEGIVLGLPLVIILVYMFVIRPVQIQGDSMSPEYANNQIILTNVLAFHAASPERGDVIIFRSPVDPTKSLIKRVIGLPGETVMIEGGNVYINDKKLDETSYLSTASVTKSGSIFQEGNTLRVPLGQYFILGDNRTNSIDSREWGFIRTSDIIGKAENCILFCSPNKSKN